MENGFTTILNRAARYKINHRTATNVLTLLLNTLDSLAIRNATLKTQIGHVFIARLYESLTADTSTAPVNATAELFRSSAALSYSRMELLNTLLENSMKNKQILQEIKGSSSELVKKLYRCADGNLQLLLVELLWRLIVPSRKNENDRIVAAGQAFKVVGKDSVRTLLVQHFLNIRRDDFQPGLRAFMNNFNELRVQISRNQARLIHSFSPKRIIINGGRQFEHTKDAPLWIDLGPTSLSMRLPELDFDTHYTIFLPSNVISSSTVIPLANEGANQANKDKNQAKSKGAQKKTGATKNNSKQQDGKSAPDTSSKKQDAKSKKSPSNGRSKGQDSGKQAETSSVIVRLSITITVSPLSVHQSYLESTTMRPLISSEVIDTEAHPNFDLDLEMADKQQAERFLTLMSDMATMGVNNISTTSVVSTMSAQASSSRPSLAPRVIPLPRLHSFEPQASIGPISSASPKKTSSPGVREPETPKEVPKETPNTRMAYENVRDQNAPLISQDRRKKTRSTPPQAKITSPPDNHMDVDESPTTRKLAAAQNDATLNSSRHNPNRSTNAAQDRAEVTTAKTTAASPSKTPTQSPGNVPEATFKVPALPAHLSPPNVPPPAPENNIMSTPLAPEPPSSNKTSPTTDTTAAASPSSMNVTTPPSSPQNTRKNRHVPIPLPPVEQESVSDVSHSSTQSTEKRVRPKPALKPTSVEPPRETAVQNNSNKKDGKKRPYSEVSPGPNVPPEAPDIEMPPPAPKRASPPAASAKVPVPDFMTPRRSHVSVAMLSNRPPGAPNVASPPSAIATPASPTRLSGRTSDSMDINLARRLFSPPDNAPDLNSTLRNTTAKGESYFARLQQSLNLQRQSAQEWIDQAQQEHNEKREANQVDASLATDAANTIVEHLNILMSATSRIAQRSDESFEHFDSLVTQYNNINQWYGTVFDSVVEATANIHV